MPRPLLALVCVSIALTTTPAAEPGQAGAPPPPIARGPLVIDHRSVADFDRIPAEYLQKASRLRFLLRSASIGVNIDQGLNCLMDHFPDRPRRPNFCDRDIPPGQVVYGRQYDRRNWAIETRGNPGWWDKVRDFVERFERAPPGEAVDVASFNFNYGDGIPGSAIAGQFFQADAGHRLRNVLGVHDVAKAHPRMVVVWWTMTLPRRSAPEMEEFNRKMREYAREHGLVLFDLAAIGSHGRGGAPCTDNQGRGLEALCQAYTNEKDSGHLNALGSQRAAKALWVLMARLAGWDG